MNRYEEILIRLVAAQVGRGEGAEHTADSMELRRAAELLERHFEKRESTERQNRAQALMAPLSNLLKRQAE